MKQYNSCNCFGGTEENYHQIFLGRPIRYYPFDMDYKNQVKPFLLKYNIEYLLNLKGVSFDDEASPLCRLDDLFLSILSQCFKTKYYLPEQKELFEPAYYSWIAFDKLLEELPKKKTIAGIIAKAEQKRYEKMMTFGEYCRREEGDSLSEHAVARNKIISFLQFLDTLSRGLFVEDFIPKSLYNQLGDVLFLMLDAVSMGYGISIPDKVLDKIKLIKSEHPNSEANATKIEKMPNVRLVKHFLVLSDFKFETTNDLDMISSLLDIENHELLSGVCFQNCLFDNVNCTFRGVQGNLFFQSCLFEKGLNIYQILEGLVEFDSCTFHADLNCPDISFGTVSEIHILNSFFNQNCTLDFSWWKPKEYGSNYLRIENTLIEGSLDMSHTYLPLDVFFKNVTIMGSLKCQETKISDISKIENIAFPTKITKEIELSRKELFQALKNSQLINLAKNLQLTVDGQRQERDDNLYQQALKTGFLSADFAAKYLGRSKVYLAKKRQDDRKKITRESIPFITSGRKITYPLEALKAFLVQDWKTLKDLRKKYPIPQK